MPNFFQQPPTRDALFPARSPLRALLRWKLTPQAFAAVEPDINAFAARCAGPLWDLAREAERDAPVHIAYDAWGRRTDALRLSPAWRALRAEAAQQGLVALAYEHVQGAPARLHQFAKLFLFHPSSAFVSCPAAMSDGAARVLARFATEDALREAFTRLTSRDPAQAWTSGQWMTETVGGSDVSGTQTQAVLGDGQWRLHGTKFFASAAESEIALALARKPGAQQGSRGLTLFMARPRRADGAWDGVIVRRLKDKLGTRALATAELDLVGCPAIQIGVDGEGVRNVATMLNVTRLHNSICAIGEAAHACALLEDYSQKRTVFERPLAAHVLHRRLIGALQAEVFAGLILTLELAGLLGCEDANEANERDRRILRLMTPVCKIVTADIAVRVLSATVEGFGGAGYMEDVGIARRLRDAHVFPIWEGPPNVLALDMLRAIGGRQGLEPVMADMEERLAAAAAPEWRETRDELARHVHALRSSIAALLAADTESQQASARDLALHLGALYPAVLALSFAQAQPAAAAIAAVPRALAARVSSWRPTSLQAVEAAMFPQAWP
ncbi:MAG: acyl-CoA dehydrogenase protein, partial [Hyphomicrobiales bacterium]|nr:acyl-CoA dehydrogenase protein [Hyphomicrobiales bacterium]